MKKKFKMPHAFVIIVIMLILTSILTYFIPAGEYVRYVNESGTTIVDGSSFHYVESSPVPFWGIPIAIVEALSEQSSVIFSIMLIAGSIEVILATRMFHVFCHKMTSICQGKEKWFIPLLMTFFSLLGITQAPNKFIGFAPVGVMLAYTLGYDALVGISIVLLGVAVGFISGVLGPTTALAQQLAELLVYCVLIGFGAAVAVILNKASVLDTVVMSLSSALNYVPGIFRGPVLMLANTVINFFVLSGSGQAAVVMPVMTPVADLSNVSRQTAVLAYKLGDGFTNYLYPHSSSLMGFIGAVGITYDKWVKFFGKLFVIWMIGGCIILMIAPLINY